MGVTGSACLKQSRLDAHAQQSQAQYVVVTPPGAILMAPTNMAKNEALENISAPMANHVDKKPSRACKKAGRGELSHAFQLEVSSGVVVDPSSLDGHVTTFDPVLGNTSVASEDLLDINTATEEELMTLPGITRTLAENLVRHRDQIGGFRYLEDVAIVSGFGAAKLKAIKNEIKLGGWSSRHSSPTQPVRRNKGVRRVSTSCSPSLLNFEASNVQREITTSPFKTVLSPSQQRVIHSSPLKHSPLPPFKALRSSGHRRSASGHGDYLLKGGSYDSPALVDVNVATVFQLMTVPGLSQSLAQTIYMHRNRFGPFHTTQELRRVKGMTSSLLENFKPYLMVTQEIRNESHRSSFSTIAGDGGRASLASQRDDSGIGDAASKKLNSSSIIMAAEEAKAALSSRPLSTSIVDLYLPFIEKSYRPQKPPFEFRRGEKEVFRIATWNLQNCGNEKVSNIGVTEVIIMTILESGVSIAGFQDLRDVHVVEHLCAELNHPTLPAVKNWVGLKGEWRNCVSHARNNRLVGFIYDSSQNIKLLKSHDYNCPLGGAILSRATFKVGFKLKAFSIINAHVFTKDADKLLSAFSTLRDALNECAVATKNAPVIILSSLAHPRKSCHVWNVLGLNPLLDVKLAQYAGGRSEDDNTQAQDETQRQPDLNGIPLAQQILAKMSATSGLRLRASTSTPNSPRHGIAEGRVIDDGIASDNEGEVGGTTGGGAAAGDAALQLIDWESLSPSKNVVRPEANLFMDVKSATLHSGHGQVVDQGLSSPWIPDGWAWGGSVSHFRPLWAEFYKEFESVEVLNRRSPLRSSMPPSVGNKNPNKRSLLATSRMFKPKGPKCAEDSTSDNQAKENKLSEEGSNTMRRKPNKTESASSFFFKNVQNSP